MLFELPTNVTDAVRDYVQKWGFSKPKFRISGASKNGDSFSGDLYRIVLTNDVSNGDSENNNNTSIQPKSFHQNEITLIAKLAPKHELRRQMFNVQNQFDREIYVYENIIPALEEFQKIRLTQSEIFQNYPKCIFTSEEVLNEFIIMTDLTSKGYKNSDRPTPLGFKKCALVFESIAKFHAISFALKDQNLTKFNELTCKLKENVFTSPVNELFETFLINKVDNAITTLNDGDALVKEKLLKFKDVYAESMVDCIQNKEDSVICHGDCWISNLMFKEETKTQPEKVQFIDWQICRNASPATDLSYFIFCCTDAKLRKRLPELLKIYHNSLISRINILGSNGLALFPFEKLESHMKKHAKFGLGMALMTLHTSTCQSIDLPNIVSSMETMNFSDMDLLCEEFIQRPAYIKRMSEVCRDMVAFGYL